MADTQRTRAQILALWADNVTGDISAQDGRDLIVTIMPDEFTYPADFWKQPDPAYLTTDLSGRGWKLYSQIVDSAVSHGSVLYLTASGTWKKANASTAKSQPGTALSLSAYVAAASDATLLRIGLAFDSSWTWTSGGLIYLDSQAAKGLMTQVAPVSAQILGIAETGRKVRFQPSWVVQ